MGVVGVDPQAIWKLDTSGLRQWLPYTVSALLTKGLIMGFATDSIAKNGGKASITEADGGKVTASVCGETALKLLIDPRDNEAAILDHLAGREVRCARRGFDVNGNAKTIVTVAKVPVKAPAKASAKASVKASVKA
jgi:hypothetical protein